MLAKTWEHFPASIYRDRAERNRFLARTFANELRGGVLNVGGGGEKHLAEWLPASARYVEVDIAGKPDLIVDLERELPLPFEDRSFDTVVCTEVLEHVDNLHAVLAELCRLADRQVIISLPNAWATLKSEIVRPTGSSGKFYGLPASRPEDRHKWFFNFTEAERFLAEAGQAHGFAAGRWLSCGYVHDHGLQTGLRLACGLLLGDKARFNLFATTIWVMLERQSPRPEAP